VKINHLAFVKKDILWIKKETNVKNVILDVKVVWMNLLYAFHVLENKIEF
jgi:hypothetical protein